MSDTGASQLPKSRLLRAVQLVQDGHLSTRKAAKYFKVPYSTVLLHLKGWRNRKKVESIVRGRPTVIDNEAESELARNLKIMSRYGFGLTRKETLLAVGIYVKENKIKNEFKDGIPGEKWFCAHIIDNLC